VVVDADFNQHDVPIGPNDTNTGPDLGVFSLSSGPTGTTLIVDGGSRLTTGRLVTGSTPSGAPAQITISGAGSTIELLGAQQAGRSAIDFASQGTSTLTISGGGQLTFSPTASACTQTSQFGVGPICTVVNIGNAAGSTATVVVTGAGSRLDLDPENLDPDTFHITQIGGAVVTQSGFGTLAGLGAGEFDLLDVSGLIDITGGEILLSFLDGFAFTPGQVLPFLTAGAGISIGADVTFAFSGVPDDFTLELDRTSGTLITRLVSVPEPSTLGLLAIGVAALCLGAAHRRAARGKRSIAEL